MVDEFKLGVVQSQIVGGISQQQEGLKLGVVLPDAPAAALPPPGLGVVRRELIPTPHGAPTAPVLQEIDYSRIYELKRTWVNSKGQPGSDQVLRDVVSEVYSLSHLPPPAIYRFESPLAAMLAIRHVGHLHGIEVDHHYTPLEHLKGSISMYLGPIDQAKKRNDEFARVLIAALAEPVASQVNAMFLDRFTDQITSMIGSLSTSVRLFDPISQFVMRWWSAIAESRCWWWPYSRFLVVAEEERRVG